MLKEEILVENLLSDIIGSEGYNIVRISSFTKKRQKFMQIMIENINVDIPITIDDCCRVHAVTTNVFEDQRICGDVQLEVSSPGLERPLVKLKDFENYSGYEVFVKLRVDVNGRKKYTGVISLVDNGMISLKVDGDLLDLSYDNIALSHLTMGNFF